MEPASDDQALNEALDSTQIQDLREAVRSALNDGPNSASSRNPALYHRLMTEPIARVEDSLIPRDVMRQPAHKRSNMMTFPDYIQRHGADLFKMHFTQVEFNSGDTLVFVDFPKPAIDKAAPVDCDGMPFRSQQFRVHSEKLLATGSAQFADMFQPTYQFRIMRRRKLVNQLPEGVKYAIDLTPPSEGDDMVFQITELSLTPGITKWWSAYARHEVPFFLVKGHDDVCPCKELADRSMTAALMEPLAANDSMHLEESQDQQSVVMLPLTVSELVSARNHGKMLQIEEVPAHFDIPDYCPIRHRNGIIRLLMLIEDKEVCIDSAPRLWTLVALAKIWDCVSAVQDQALQWLLHPKNSKFIEVLPEEAIRIGGVLENPQITRTAFRILVNEHALEQMASDKMKEAVDFHHVTLFGRRKGDPGDEFSNLIQHAALAFIERMAGLLAELNSGDVLAKWDIPEYRKLLKIEEALQSQKSQKCDKALGYVASLKEKLNLVLKHDIAYIQRSIYTPPALNRKQADSDRATYVEPQDFQELPDIFRLMTPLQKLLTRYPIKHLENTWVNWYESNNTAKPWSHFKTASATEALGNDMARLYKDFKDYHPWDDEIDPSFYDILSKNWMQPHDTLYPLKQYRFDAQVEGKLQKLGGHLLESDQDLQVMMTNHLLLTLTNNETKFLPLWAGGCNDGTGGVFENQLPPTDMGANGPGPAYHTGRTIPSDTSSLDGSFVDDMSAMNMAGSSYAASIDVHDSVSTIYQPDEIIAEDKSIASESFHSDLSDYHEARKTVAVPGQEKEAIPQSLDEFLAADSDSDSTATIGCDDFDTLDDDDFELDMSSQSDSVTEGGETDAEMVTV